jgi:hypothetical protein
MLMIGNKNKNVRENGALKINLILIEDIPLCLYNY